MAIRISFTKSWLSKNTIEYIFNDVGYTGDLFVHYTCSKNSPYLSPDNYVLSSPTQFPNFNSGLEAVLNYSYPVPYTADLTVNFNYAGSGEINSFQPLYLNIGDNPGNNNYYAIITSWARILPYKLKNASTLFR